MTVNEFLHLLADTLRTDDKIEVGTKRADIKEWDSMGQIQILAMLEDRFEVKLEMEELVALDSVQDILNILKMRNIYLG